MVPPTGFEPALPPPEGGALSPELRGPGTGTETTSQGAVDPHRETAGSAVSILVEEVRQVRGGVHASGVGSAVLDRGEEVRVGVVTAQRPLEVRPDVLPDRLEQVLVQDNEHRVVGRAHDADMQCEIGRG